MTTTVPTSSTGHSAAEASRSWRTPILLGIGALVTLVAFGLLGRDADVSFSWVSRGSSFDVPPTVLASRVVGIASGIIALAAAAFAAWRVSQRKKAPIWTSLVVGIVFIVALTAWIAAGRSVPVVFILGGAITLATPIVLGALAGVIGERVGVVNIGIEAQLLAGAFAAAVVASTTKSFTAALIAAMIVGALLAMVLAAFSIVYLVDQIIVGVVLIALVTALTNFLYSAVIGANAGALNNPGTLPIIRIPLLADIPVLGPVFFNQRLTVYLMFILVPLTWFVLYRTRWGLRIRALGEHPLAADTVGIRVNRWRFWTLSVAGLIAGLGGAALTIGSVGAFVREMSAGQGFIALAAVILGRWNPFGAALAALLFGFASNYRVWAGQAGSAIPPEIIGMTPYVVTLIAVALVAGRVLGPKAAGKPYIKE